jgi:hypothetical protein
MLRQIRMRAVELRKRRPEEPAQSVECYGVSGRAPGAHAANQQGGTHSRWRRRRWRYTTTSTLIAATPATAPTWQSSGLRRGGT